MTHTCPISNYSVKTSKDWVFTVEKSKYMVEVSIIGDNILHVKNIGYGTSGTSKTAWSFINDIYIKELKGRKIFLVNDYSEYKGANSTVRNNYINWIKEHTSDILGVYVYGTSSLTKIFLKTGRLLLNGINIQILDTYEETILKIKYIKERTKSLEPTISSEAEEEWVEGQIICNLNSVNYTIVKSWYQSNEDLIVKTYLINENIFIRKFYGVIKEDAGVFTEKAFQEIMDETKISKFHIYIQFGENVSMPLKFRKYGVSWANKHHKKILTGGYFNSSIVNRIAMSVAKTFMYHKDLKSRLFMIENIHEIFEKIDNFNSISFSNNLFEERLKVMNKEELYKIALATHLEKNQILENQNTEIQKIYNKLGRLSWDADYNYDEDNIDIRNNPFSDLNNAIILVQEDVKTLLKKRDELVSKAEESDRLKSAFLANMSHEIRTPLNAILGFTEILESGENNIEDSRKYIEIIKDSSENLLNIINDILDLSKIESKQLHIEKTDFQIHKTVTNACQLFKKYKEIKSSDIELIIENTLEPNLLINSDELRIQQILNNLISNAIKFTKKGYVKVIAKYENEFLIIRVEDTGIGVNSDKQEAIFDRFIQEDDGISRIYSGSGLGLSISKSLSELLGGDITLESEKDKGSTFELKIPVKVVSEVKKVKTKSSTVKVFNQNTILIVEDNPDNRFFLEVLLKSAKLNIIWATDGKEALDMFHENKNEIELILLDIQLPIYSGEIVAEKIRVNYPDLPIIAQTANAMADDKEKYLNSHFTDYISKPINRDILFTKLSKYLIK